MSKESLIASLRTVPDYPKKGILFWDVTTLFKNPAAFKEVEDILYEEYKDKGITKVAGVESRGFVMGAALASRLGAGFVLIRKPGKLPAETVSLEYELEYGHDKIEIHTDAITPDDVVLVHDDLLATGGTASAAVKLVKMFNPRQVYASFIIYLYEFGSIRKFPADVPVTSVLKLGGK